MSATQESLDHDRIGTLEGWVKGHDRLCEERHNTTMHALKRIETKVEDSEEWMKKAAIGVIGALFAVALALVFR